MLNIFSNEKMSLSKVLLTSFGGSTLGFWGSLGIAYYFVDRRIKKIDKESDEIIEKRNFPAVAISETNQGIAKRLSILEDEIDEQLIYEPFLNPALFYERNVYLKVQRERIADALDRLEKKISDKS